MSDSTKAIFLSYAHEDAAAATRIADALRGFGMEVWFDQNELRGGDSWDGKIRSQIRECALFLPVISANTQSRSEGYFRREWRLAVDRTHDMADGRAFLVPVVVDDTDEYAALVPEDFRRVQWTKLAGGVPTPEFVAQVKRLLDGKAMEAGRHRPAVAGVGDPGPASTKSATTKGIPRWTWGALTAVLVGVAVALFTTRSKSPETLDVKSSVLNVERSAAAPVAADKSIAVLPFADLSEARNSEYFSDGISEELLNVLAKVPGLRVAARTSAFFFKGKNLPITEIAQKLNVAYVVEGSVQRSGERVKITAQLIKAADGFHVWSDTFTRDLKDVFAVQEEIAGLIAKNLSLKLGVTSAAATVSVNPAAFELLLQGRQAWNLRTEEGYARAEEFLNRALALEPNFARAHAALADVWLVRDSSASLISLFGQRDSPAIRKILTQIERALALDPNSAEAYASLGNARWNNWQFAEATQALQRAIALNPNYASAHQWLGRVLLADGRVAEAEAALRRAAELDPLSHRILDNYSIALRAQGRFAESLAVNERALELKPDSVQAQAWKALDLSSLGRHAEAVVLARQVVQQELSYAVYAVEVFTRAGLKPEAEQIYAKLLASPEARLKPSALVRMGRHEEALAALDPAGQGVQDASELLFDAAYDPVRADPRFVNFLATLGLTEAHARAQAWRAAHPLPAPAKK